MYKSLTGSADRVFSAQGQPSGEAFIQMDSEGGAFGAANSKHHRYMVFGKKQRYIEVFQCSGEDMSVVLTGGGQQGKLQSGQGGGGAQQGGLVSPGMLPSVVPGYVDPGLALASHQPGMLPLGVPQLLPQLLPPAPRQEVWLGGLGVPQVAPQLVMLPPQHRYLLPSPHAGLLAQPQSLPAGGKRTHEQAFLPSAVGPYTGSLPPKRPPVMYNTGGNTPPAPALLPTPGVFPAPQGPTTPSVAAYPAV